jgi:hypothetical protein
MRPSSTIATRTFAFFAGLCALAIFPAGLRAGECVTGRGLVSNDIAWLTGSGDTLWMVAQRDAGPAFNMIAGKDAVADPTNERNWWSYTLGCRKGLINDLTTAGGLTVASLDTAPNVLWTYDAATGGIVTTVFSWPQDSVRRFTVSDIAGAGGSFFCAALDGGLVGWNVAADRKTVFIPGADTAFDLPSLKITDLPAFDSTRRVTGVEVVRNDSLLLVVTPARLWLFSLADSSWDSTVTAEFDDPGLRFAGFEFVFVNRLDRSRPLYSIAGDTAGGETASRLFKYSRGTRQWKRVFDRAPKALSFGPRGYYYTLFDEPRPGTTLRNIIRVYRDTLGDSGVSANPLPVITDDRIHARMTRAHDIDVPTALNDVLFVPRSDSSGYLWIASSEGLFFSRNETPGAAWNDTVSFTLIKRAPAVAGGLKKTYARPGILTPAAGPCKFIYNVSKSNTKVTIRVFDFNMDLVRTIIENRVRQPGSQGGPLGRSTVESEDSWDGTNGRGRPVAPGVYYYKITTSTGERSFGKIVVAR